MEKVSTDKLPNSALLSEEWPEYRLVIPADEPVSKQVRHLRMLWEERFGKDQIAEKPPSITLACFTAREEMESTLMRWIQRICDQQQVFAVTLNNISALPPHLVYIRVQDELPFAKLAGQLKALEDFMNDRKIFDKPFIKLGSMPTGQPPENWLLYTHQIFHAAFTAKKLVLLRKEALAWNMVCQFPFRNTTTTS